MSTPIEKLYERMDPNRVQRVRSAMEMEKIKTIEELCTWNDRPLWDPKSLCRIRNTGPKTIHAIKDALGQIGLALDMQEPAAPVDFGVLLADRLTTRDAFAIAALPALLNNYPDEQIPVIARSAYQQADAMLEARKA